MLKIPVYLSINKLCSYFNSTLEFYAQCLDMYSPAQIQKGIRRISRVAPGTLLRQVATPHHLFHLHRKGCNARFYPCMDERCGTGLVAWPVLGCWKWSELSGVLNWVCSFPGRQWQNFNGSCLFSGLSVPRTPWVKHLIFMFSSNTRLGNIQPLTQWLK